MHREFDDIFDDIYYIISYIIYMMVWGIIKQWKGLRSRINDDLEEHVALSPKMRKRQETWKLPIFVEVS